MGRLVSAVRLNWWRRKEVKVHVGKGDSCVSRHCSEGKSNILLSVFPDYISLVCFSAAHWGDTSERCVLEEHAAFPLDVGLTGDLRGSSG